MSRAQLTWFSSWTDSEPVAHVTLNLSNFKKDTDSASVQKQPEKVKQ